MATETRPAPKSSLSAARAPAAPWGLPAPVASRSSVGVAAPRSGSGAPTRSTRSAAPSVKSATMRSAGERRFVASLLASAVGLTIALAATGARAAQARAAAQERMDGTLGRASLAQLEFRSKHERFALWDELAAGGAQLPEELRVVSSNASSSHWFLKVQDMRTGVTCARVGQLLDAPNMPVIPDCERPAR